MGVLRKAFEVSREELWENLCKEIGADFVEGGLWKGNRVEATAGHWRIVLDTYEVNTIKSSLTHTRMRAPFINSDKFYFKIYPDEFPGSIEKLFGMKAIKTGFESLDRTFVIKSNDEGKIKQLLSDEKIRKLIEKEPSIRLQIKNDEGFFGPHFPEDVDELFLEIPEDVKEIDRLITLYNLFSEVLNQLCFIGSAYENPPDIKL
jgi:hypothetical protein